MHKHLFNNVDGFFVSVIGAWLSITSAVWSGWNSILLVLFTLLMFSMMIANIRLFIDEGHKGDLLSALLFIVPIGFFRYELMDILSKIYLDAPGHYFTIIGTLALWGMSCIFFECAKKFDLIHWITTLWGE